MPLDEPRQPNRRLSFGYPITRRWGIKMTYLGIRARELVGFDSDTIALGLSTLW